MSPQLIRGWNRNEADGYVNASGTVFVSPNIKKKCSDTKNLYDHKHQTSGKLLNAQPEGLAVTGILVQ
ncbi:MAG: hypothetical protein AAGE59_26705 [Cyanobacteria bacterium P01_F01_bin.86]